MTDPCVNLKELYGSRYRVGWDPAYDPSNRPKDKLDPWYMLIPCQYGTIGPYGGDYLLVETADTATVTKAKLRRASWARNYCDGDDGFGSFIVHIDHFPQLAEILKPRKKRAYSEEYKQVLRDRLKATQFQPTVADDDAIEAA